MSTDRMSTTFAALADPTRRAILARLASGKASVNELAAPFEMSLPAVSKHLKVLERAGLIARGREAQWRPSRLEAGPLREVAAWVENYRQYWEESFDRLDEYLKELQNKPKKRRRRRRNGMVAKNDPAVTIRDGEFTISRVFDAPRELVWKAFTEVERLKQWWGPKGFTVKTAEVDLRPGGTFLYCLVAPEGFEMWGKWTYREIVAPERLVIVSSFSDEKGNPIRHPMEPTWPLRMLGTSTLTERDGKTTLTIATSAYEATEEERKTFEAGFDSMADGFNGTFDALADYLAKAKA